MKPDLDKNYWENRYLEGETQWDLNDVSGPLENYILQLADRKLKILIPGCGNAYEAELLSSLGFVNVYIMDIAMQPLKEFKKRNPDFPGEHLIHRDFFDATGDYDLILEQTFFCALNPTKRSDYAKKMHELLRPNGALVGVLFDVEINENEPPFGGTPQEYISYFRPYFDFKVFEPCYNSISPRAGREHFIHLIKKDDA